ncbi:MAG: tetratricopeptide repeat protein [Chloroflexota bacterium]|nr:tetratricopeptide repeat protein [Chloroflexota bacterium]
MSEVGSFGAWLGQQRKTRQLTQAELAARLGYSLETIKKIEEGKRRPSRQLAEAVADWMGIAGDQRILFVQFCRNLLTVPPASTSWPANVESAPPRRGPDSLPASTTAFIGRNDTIRELGTLLRQPSVRLLTLTGPPGIGKTRLSLQVIPHVQDAFAHGAVFVPLAAVGDPAGVGSAIAQVLGVRAAAGGSLPQMLRSYLHDKQLLLLLDNFEHLAPAAPVVSELLEAAPQLKVLVTSRSVLHLYGEHAWVVPPLTLPDPQRLPPVEELRDYEAIRLFTERATALRPDFRLTAENAPLVAEICARLEGLPLATELAAAGIQVLPPQALLARLTHRLDPPVAGPQDRPARQQTLRNAIGWSYDLLDDGERQLFRRLAPFMGGCTMEGAEAVCGLDRATDIAVWSALVGLVHMSLLRQEEVAGEPRFWMLETIRDYAAERLTAAGEADRIHAAHLRYYTTLAARADSHLRASAQLGWLERLEAEHDNCRAALRGALAQAAGAPALQLSSALWWFWRLHGYWDEGRTWLEAALAQTAPTDCSAARAAALCGAGDLARLQGDYTTARIRLAASVACYERGGDARGLVYARTFLGEALRGQGDLAAAGEETAAAVAVGRANGDPHSLALALNCLGLVQKESGDSATAYRLFAESLTLFQQSGDRWGQELALGNQGTVALQQGDYPAARDLLAAALTFDRQLGNKYGSAWVLRQLGAVAQQQAQPDQAAAFLRESLALSRELGHAALTADCLSALHT